MITEIESALAFINSEDRDTWIIVGMSIMSELGEEGFSIWDAWSSTASNYSEVDARTVWRSFTDGNIGIGTLFHEAKRNGWKNDNAPRLVYTAKKKPAPRQTGNTRAKAERTWRLATPALENHPYLIEKQIKPHGIGVLGSYYEDAPKLVQGDGNLLVIPMFDLDGNVWSIQFIGESGKKAYMAGPRHAGTFYWIRGSTNSVYICEGFATGATLAQETGQAVACAFDAHSLIPVAKSLSKRFDPCQLVIMADDDWKTPNNPGRRYAEKAAKEIGASIRLPDFSGLSRGSKDSDFNDAARLRGAHGQS